MSTRIVVTGALGCFGIATIKWLMDHGHSNILALGRSVNEERLAAAFGQEKLQMVRPMTGSVTDFDALKQCFDSFQPTHVAHLAGLQTPDCQNHPATGWATNVVGTENIYKLATDSQVQQIVAISSAAVYGPSSMYPDGPVNEDVPVRKSTVYSRTKIAVELVGERYWEMHQRRSVQTRPFVCFGPGRHQGMSAAYTMAAIATALNEAFVMPFFGTYDFSFVPDVGETHGRLLVDEAPHPFAVYNIPGSCCETSEFCGLINEAAVELGIEHQYKVTQGRLRDMPTACNLDWSRVREDFGVSCTPLKDAIRQTLEFYVKEVEAGHVTRELIHQWTSTNTSY